MRGIDMKDMLALTNTADENALDITANVTQTPENNTVAEGKDESTVAANTDEYSETGDEACDDASEQAQINIEFKPDTLSQTLPMMGKGMLGIFLVIAVIIVIVCALNKITKPKEKSES